jgi:hypothetical protein
MLEMVMFGRIGRTVAGLFAGRPTSEAQLFPGGLGDAALQKDVWRLIVLADEFATSAVAAEPCHERQVEAIELLDGPSIDADGAWVGGPWSEQWTVDRCGTQVSYTIDFSPDPERGTKISVRDEIALASPE